MGGSTPCNESGVVRIGMKAQFGLATVIDGSYFVVNG
jgi:hypothetical protein